MRRPSKVYRPSRLHGALHKSSSTVVAKSHPSRGRAVRRGQASSLTRPVPLSNKPQIFHRLGFNVRHHSGGDSHRDCVRVLLARLSAGPVRPRLAESPIGNSDGADGHTRIASVGRRRATADLLGRVSVDREAASGGESGIRTHGTVSRTHAFQACALSHSAISPDRLS
jgi:hypothetical protein